jgi:hypothetical protein
MPVAKDKTPVQTPDPGQGTPPRDEGRSSDIILVEIAKLQSDGEHNKRDLTELRTDNRELRDRMAKLEVKVDHLPSKGFIVVVVTSSLVIFGAVVSIAPLLRGFLTHTPPAITATTPPAKSP